MLKRFIIISLLIFSRLAFADGFSQFNYVNDASFNYPNNYSNSMIIGFQVSSSGGLNNSLDSNAVDLNGLADGNAHSNY